MKATDKQTRQSYDVAFQGSAPPMLERLKLFLLRKKKLNGYPAIHCRFDAGTCVLSTKGGKKKKNVVVNDIERGVSEEVFDKFEKSQHKPELEEYCFILHLADGNCGLQLAEERFNI